MLQVIFQVNESPHLYNLQNNNIEINDLRVPSSLIILIFPKGYYINDYSSRSDRNQLTDDILGSPWLLFIKTV